MNDPRRALALWARILGVLLILLGLTLFASPEIWYTKRQVAGTASTQVVGKAERVLVIPRVVAVAIMGAGVVVWLVGGRRS